MKKLNEQIIGGAPATVLERAEYELADGRVKEYAIVHRPMAAGVIALRVTDTGAVEVLLVEQPRPAVNDPALLEIVAGKMDVLGEVDPYATAQRELGEEAGLHARHWRLLAQDLYPSPGYSDEHVHVLAAWGLTEVPRRADDAHIRAGWRSLDEAVSLVLTGQVRDMKSRDAIWAVNHLLTTGQLAIDDAAGGPAERK